MDDLRPPRLGIVPLPGPQEPAAPAPALPPAPPMLSTQPAEQLALRTALADAQARAQEQADLDAALREALYIIRGRKRAAGIRLVKWGLGAAAVGALASWLVGDDQC